MKTEFHHNYTEEQLFERLGEFLDGDKVSLSFNLVYAKNNNGKWGFLIGSCFLNGDGKNHSEVYSEFAFVNKVIKNTSLEDIICLVDEAGASLDGEYITVWPGESANLSCRESIIPSCLSGNSFPHRCFSVNLSRDSRFSNSPLVGYGLPYRSSSRQFVKEFLGLRRYHGESDGDNGLLSIYVEDKRGRIEISEECVSVISESADLMLLGQLSESELVSIRSSENHKSDKIDKDACELWLIDSQNSLIDFVSASHWSFSPASNNNANSGQFDYIDLIEKGESHTCEFKPYIRLNGNVNTKAEQLERTVCAFSNASGGKLLIGVSDDGVIEGIDEEMRKDFNKAIDDCLELYIRAIRKRLNEKLRYGQCADIKAVQIGDRHIIEVDTVRTKGVNYYLETKQGFMRRGATSAKTTAADERENIKDRSSGLDYFSDQLS